MSLNEKIFREYDIRGIADRDLTSPLIEKIGRALAAAVREKGGKRFSIGQDCRTSSPRIADALASGLMAGGVDVVDIGQVPTPLLYFSVFHLNLDGGVMITGSHNPAEHNGLKICVGKSTIHGDEIQSIKQRILAEKFSSGKGARSSQDVIAPYIDYVTEGIQHPLEVKVVVDSGNGMGGVVAPELYRKLGCDVTDLFSEPDGTFPNHHPDPTVLENLEDLTEAVKRTKAEVGIAFDGDADRIGVVDATGKHIFGDELLVLFSRSVLKKKPGTAVISEVKASHRLFQDIAAHGGKPILWKTGHSLIKSKMKESGALLAGEMSGHMFFADRYFGFDDAIYAGARLLEILHLEGKSPLELLADLPPSHTTPEIRVDCPDEIKFEVVEKVKKTLIQAGYKVNAIDGARIEFDDGWGLVRASNTQPVLVYRFEASSPSRLKEIQELLEGTVSKAMAR